MQIGFLSTILILLYLPASLHLFVCIGHSSLGWNSEEVLSHLKSKGVAIEKTAADPNGNSAWIRDPDGNQIELWEPSESV